MKQNKNSVLIARHLLFGDVPVFQAFNILRTILSISFIDGIAAFIFNREVVKKCGIKDVFGKEWDWDKFRTILSAIGSYVRAAKIIEEKSQVQELWKHITKYN